MQFEDTFIGRPNTVATYRSLFLRHIDGLDVFAPHWNESQTLTTIQEWQKKDLAPNTMKMLLRLLKDYIAFSGGPTIETKRYHALFSKSEQQKEVLALNKEQASALMRLCQTVDPNFYPILLLGLHAGMRRGEIFGLRCGDVDMFKNRIRVAHSYNGPTKNGKTRFVPMSKELEATMVGARNLLMRPTDDRIFEIMNPNPRLRRLCRYAKLPEIRFHDLRHTFATLALEDNVSPRQVAAWLGHSNVHTTLSIYWNLTQGESSVDSFLP